MEMTDDESRKFAIARAHANANLNGKTFVVAFNKEKNEALLCCPLQKLLAEHPFGLTEKDVFYRAEPGTSVPAHIA